MLTQIIFLLQFSISKKYYDTSFRDDSGQKMKQLKSSGIYTPFQTLNFLPVQIMFWYFLIYFVSEENSWNQLNNWKKSSLLLKEIMEVESFLLSHSYNVSL